jgi:hypothetical protein
MGKEGVGYVNHVQKGEKKKMNEDNELDLMVKVIATFLFITWIFAAIGIAALLSFFWG